MKLLKNKLFPVLLTAFILLSPIVATGAIWVQHVGLLPGTSVVLSSDAGAIDRYCAAALRPLYGARIGLCNGTNDEVQLAAADAAANYGKTQLSVGVFNIDAALSFDNGSKIIGQGSGNLARATTLNITGTNFGILLTPSGNYMGGLRDLTIVTPANFATYALRVQNAGTDIRGRHILGNISIKAYNAGIGEGTPDITAGSIGLDIVCTGGFNQNVYENIDVNGFEKAIRLYVNRVGSGWYYLNGNFFTNWTAGYSRYPLWIEANSDYAGPNAGDIVSNFFQGLVIEPYGVNNFTDDGIHLTGVTGDAAWFGVRNNVFQPIIVWDNHYLEGDAIFADVKTYHNYFRGTWNWADENDLGTGNFFGDNLIT